MTEHLVHSPEADEKRILPPGYLEIVVVVIRPFDNDDARLHAEDLARADTDGMALPPEAFRE